MPMPPWPRAARLLQRASPACWSPSEVREPGRRSAALRIFESHGARDLEAILGRIVDGQWVDFDATAALRPLGCVVPAAAALRRKSGLTPRREDAKNSTTH
jgi:hypothetical protein